MEAKPRSDGWMLKIHESKQFQRFQKQEETNHTIDNNPEIRSTNEN